MENKEIAATELAPVSMFSFKAGELMGYLYKDERIIALAYGQDLVDRLKELLKELHKRSYELKG